MAAALSPAKPSADAPFPRRQNHGNKRPDPPDRRGLASFHRAARISARRTRRIVQNPQRARRQRRRRASPSTDYPSRCSSHHTYQAKTNISLLLQRLPPLAPRPRRKRTLSDLDADHLPSGENPSRNVHRRLWGTSRGHSSTSAYTAGSGLEAKSTSPGEEPLLVTLTTARKRIMSRALSLSPSPSSARVKELSEE
ncbi:hypothetical protein BC567DRAFT_57051 [Phyllosticta citribraziliensis]